VLRPRGSFVKCPHQSKYSRFQYVESTPAWSQACDIGNAPSDITELEAAIHSHQSLYEAMCQAYTEVMNFDYSFFFKYQNDFIYREGPPYPSLFLSMRIRLRTGLVQWISGLWFLPTFARRLGQNGDFEAFAAVTTILRLSQQRMSLSWLASNLERNIQKHFSPLSLFWPTFLLSIYLCV